MVATSNMKHSFIVSVYGGNCICTYEEISNGKNCKFSLLFSFSHQNTVLARFSTSVILSLHSLISMSVVP